MTKFLLKSQLIQPLSGRISQSLSTCPESISLQTERSEFTALEKGVIVAPTFSLNTAKLTANTIVNTKEVATSDQPFSWGHSIPQKQELKLPLHQFKQSLCSRLPMPPLLRASSYRAAALGYHCGSGVNQIDLFKLHQHIWHSQKWSPVTFTAIVPNHFRKFQGKEGSRQGRDGCINTRVRNTCRV